MKIRILGCGTSAGVPRIGNDWGQCDPGEPRNRRLRSSILIESDDRRLLIDCGPDLREQLLATGVAAVAGLIVTHDHADHVHGIDEVRTLARNAGGALPLWARRDVLDRLAQRFGYIFSDSEFYSAVAEGRALDDKLMFGAATLRFVDQPHGRVQSLGLRIDEGPKSAVYAIDFSHMTDDMVRLYEGARVMICDCLSRRPHPTHAHLDAVLGWARDLRVGQLYLSHLNNSMDYQSLVSELPDWAAPAHDGLEIEL